MGESEITEIGRLLRINSLIGELVRRVNAKVLRETNLRDSVYRAFRDTTTDTDLMNFIRMEGKKLLAEKGLLTAISDAA